MPELRPYAYFMINKGKKWNTHSLQKVQQSLSIEDTSQHEHSGWDIKSITVWVSASKGRTSLCK